MLLEGLGIICDASVEGALLRENLSCKTDQPLSTIVCPKQRKRKVRPRGRPSPRLERPVRNSIGSGEQLSACAGSLINWAVAATVYAPDQDLKAKQPGETRENIESTSNTKTTMYFLSHEWSIGNTKPNFVQSARFTKKVTAMGGAGALPSVSPRPSCSRHSRAIEHVRASTDAITDDAPHARESHR